MKPTPSPLQNSSVFDWIRSVQSNVTVACGRDRFDELLQAKSAHFTVLDPDDDRV